jgi:hypothetical protein
VLLASAVLVVTSSEKLMMISPGLTIFQANIDEVEFNLLMAGSLIAVVPVLIVAMFAQRKIVGGLGSADVPRPGGAIRRPGRKCPLGRRPVPDCPELLDVQVDLFGVVAAHDAGKAGHGQVRVIGELSKKGFYLLRVIAAHRQLELPLGFRPTALCGVMHFSHTSLLGCKG